MFLNLIASFLSFLRGTPSPSPFLRPSVCLLWHNRLNLVFPCMSSMTSVTKKSQVANLTGGVETEDGRTLFGLDAEVYLKVGIYHEI